jgi:tetratricopeptide (TPR) repeat protein
MFRKLFGRKPDDQRSSRMEIEPTISMTMSTSWSEPENERVQWVDPSNSTWRDYEEFFFQDKAWYRDAPQWRQVLRVCHAHWNLTRAIGETYYRRELDGVEPTIPLCRELIAIAPQAKVALEMHEKFEYDYRVQEIERQKKEWKRNGWGEYSGWEPILRPFKLPEHTGFKQLAIIYDKMKDYEAAIEVCREALAVDWPGDWDVRIARYSRRLDSQQKKADKRRGADVSGNVVTVATDPPNSGKPKFCNQCGSSLDNAVNFCPVCGQAIQHH